MPRSDTPRTIPPASRVAGPSVVEVVMRLWDEGRRILRTHAVLAVLEAQQAGANLVALVGAALAAVVLLVTAWMAGVVGAIAYIAGASGPWPPALLWAALANLVLAVVILLVARRYVLRVPFTATLRQLRQDSHELASGVDRSLPS